MVRRSLLDAEIDRLYALPTDPDLIARHYTLDAVDLAHAARRRRPANRFGFALQLCVLRYPGRLLAPDEPIPIEILRYLCHQLDILEQDALDYAARAATRGDHLALIQRVYGHRRFADCDEPGSAGWLAGAAWRIADGPAVAAAFMEKLRADRIAAPSRTRFARLVRASLAAADRKAVRIISDALSAAQRRGLDALLEKTDEGTLSRLGWCRQLSGGVGADTILRLLEQRRTLHAIGIDARIFADVPERRRRRLGAEAARLTADHFTAMRSLSRRRALLAVVVFELEPGILDAAIETFDRFISLQYQKDKNKRKAHLEKEQNTIGDYMELLANLCDVIAAEDARDADPRGAIARIRPIAELADVATNARALRRSTRIDFGRIARSNHGGNRRVAAALLEACVFEEPSGPHLLTMLDCLKNFYAGDRRKRPSPIILTLPGQRWIASVFEGNDFRMAAYEFWILVELRRALRSGRVIIEGSVNFRPIEEKLIPPADWAALRVAGPSLLAVPLDAETYLAERRATLERRMAEVGAKAAAGALPGVRFTPDGFVVDPIEAEAAKTGCDLDRWIKAEMPLTRITDVMAQVCALTRFHEAFTHVRGGRPPENPLPLLATLLARATGLGLEAMAHASGVLSLRQLALAELAYVRDETLTAATARLTEAIRSHPLAAAFGAGEHSSSDGQHFPLGGKDRRQGAVNPHKEALPSVSIYTHLSENYAPFRAVVISVNESEAPHVIDGLFYRGAPPIGAVHHVDGGGVSDHVFGLCAIIGIRFVPRIPKLPKRLLYSFATPSKTSPFRGCIARRIDTRVIRAQWDNVLRLGASIRLGDVAASWILKRFAACPAQSDLGRAVQEIGRLERTLFTLDWLDSLDLRRKTTLELNKGEERNRLAREIFSIGGGYMRLSTDKLQYIAGALNIITAVITYWDMEHMWRAIEKFRAAGGIVTDAEISRLSPLRWRHINMHGDYVWPQRLPDIPKP